MEIQQLSVRKIVQRGVAAVPGPASSPELPRREKQQPGARVSQVQVFSRVLAAFPVPLPAPLSFREPRANLQGHLWKLVFMACTCCLLSKLNGSYKAQRARATGMAQPAGPTHRSPKRGRYGKTARTSGQPGTQNQPPENGQSENRGPSGKREGGPWKMHQAGGAGSSGTHSQLVPTAFSSFLGPGEQGTGSKALIPSQRDQQEGTEGREGECLKVTDSFRECRIVPIHLELQVAVSAAPLVHHASCHNHARAGAAPGQTHG